MARKLLFLAKELKASVIFPGKEDKSSSEPRDVVQQLPAGARWLCRHQAPAEKGQQSQHQPQDCPQPGSSLPWAALPRSSPWLWLSPAARSVTSLLTLLSTAVRVSPAACSVSSPMRFRLWKVSKCSGP